MKVLFADKFPEDFAQVLSERGHECELQPDLTADDLPDVISDYEALVVRSTKVTADTLNEARALRLVIRAGAGTNTIDKDCAKENEIAVCNVPGKNAAAVAELALGLLISIDRRIPDNVADLRLGKWDKKTYSSADGLLGKTMGIVGLGAIGMAVAQRAGAFGLHLKAIRKAGRAKALEKKIRDLGIEYVDDLDELVQSCDIVSFHVPAAPETKGLIGAKLLDKMKTGAIVLNLSRGDIVDEQALIDAMDQKGIRAGLDVYADEPGSGQGEFDSKLAQHANVYGTHHIGASTAQAQAAVAEGVVEIIDAFVDGKLLNCVNR